MNVPLYSGEGDVAFGNGQQIALGDLQVMQLSLDLGWGGKDALECLPGGGDQSGVGHPGAVKAGFGLPGFLLAQHFVMVLSAAVRERGARPADGVGSPPMASLD